jgi:predicted nucleotidyltransferase
MTPNSLELPISIEELRKLLLEHGVIKASVFGSYARGEATKDSDLDLLVELGEGKSYLDLGGFVYDMENDFKVKVDVATKLNRHFEPYITPDLVPIL